MALTATFGADFSSFYDAVQQAEVGLKSFETQAEKVGLSLDRMTDKFTGRKLIEDATLMATAIEQIGGASKLTEKELARVAATTGEAVKKLQAMGMEVPQGLADVAKASGAVAESMSLSDKAAGVLKSTFGQMFAAFSAANIASNVIGFFTNLTTGAIESASAIVDLSDKTGLSIEAVQRYGAVAKASGGDFNTFADAAFKLGTKLAGGDDSVTYALDVLGLKVADLRNMKMEDAFDAVIDAGNRLGDTNLKNRTYIELFGNTAANLIPMVGENYRQLADDAKVAEDAQVRAVNESIAAWNRAKNELQTGLLAAMGDMVIGARNIESVGLAKSMQYWALSIVAPGKAVTFLADELDRLNRTTPQTTTATTTNAAAMREQQAATLKAAEDASKLAESQRNIQETLAGSAGLTPAVRDQVKYLLEMGAAQTDVARVTGVSEAAIRAVAAEMRVEEEAARKATEELKKHAEAMDKSREAWGSLLDLYRGPEGITPSVKALAMEMLDLGANASDLQRVFSELSKGALKQLQEDFARTKQQTKDLTDAIGAMMLKAAQARKENAARQGFDIEGNRLPTTPEGQAQAEYDRRMAELESSLGALGPAGAGIDVSSIREQYWNDLQVALGNTAEAADNLTRAQQDQTPAVKDNTEANKENAPRAREAAGAHAQVAKAGSGTAAVLVQAMTGIQNAFFKAFEQSEAYQRQLRIAEAMGAAGVSTGHARIGGKIYDAFGRPTMGIPGMPVVDIPGFQGGGPTGAGGFGLLHAGEYVVPRGGALVSGGPTVHITVNGALLGTQEALARLVGDALMKSYRGGGNRIPV